jgi:hypothetical protein
MKNYFLERASLQIGDRVIISNPTPKSVLNPNSRSPMWKDQCGTVVGFQGYIPEYAGVLVKMDKYPSSFRPDTHLNFAQHEVSKIKGA